MVDNIIQTPIKNKKLSVTVSSALGQTDEGVTVSAGIGSLTKGDILKIDNEYLKVKQIGDTTFAQARTAKADHKKCPPKQQPCTRLPVLWSGQHW